MFGKIIISLLFSLALAWWTLIFMGIPIRADTLSRVKHMVALYVGY